MALTRFKLFFNTVPALHNLKKINAGVGESYIKYS